jgi:sulfur carrier protein ThiS
VAGCERAARNCRTAGIIGPVVGMMGTLQALEAIKLLSGMATPRNTLRLFDARTSAGALWRYSAPAARYAEGACRFWFNDEPLQCADGLTVAALLDSAGTAQPGVAGAQSTHPAARAVGTSSLQEGDQILLFQVIAGG